MTELSIVVPVYGCHGCLAELHRRLRASVAEVSEDVEFVYVDDRSTDGSWDALLELAAGDPAVKLVRLSRNFGQHRAITAGLAESNGRWVVVMDCDLEDRPEEIPRLYAKAQEGNDIVLTVRRRYSKSAFRNFAGRAYRRLANVLAGTDIDPRYRNLSVISRDVVREFLRFQDHERQYLLILLWLGYEHVTLEVEPDPRHVGTSSYSLGALVRVAADGILFQTTRLLRWVIYAGFAVTAIGAILALLLVYNYLVREPPPGWTSLAVIVLIIGGFLIASFGVLGLYVERIFNQVKGRPLYVVDKRVEGGFGPGSAGGDEPAVVPEADREHGEPRARV
jgi:dolichol-phosphate mannosyltransferase